MADTFTPQKKLGPKFDWPAEYFDITKYYGKLTLVNHTLSFGGKLVGLAHLYVVGDDGKKIHVATFCHVKSIFETDICLILTKEGKKMIIDQITDKDDHLQFIKLSTPTISNYGGDRDVDWDSIFCSLRALFTASKDNTS